MDGWNQGWNDPREFEQQSYYGEAYQQWEPYTQTYMPFNHTCALCGSPQHSPFECDLRFQYPEFMQEYEYTMSMHQDPMAPQALPQEENCDESPSPQFLEVFAEWQACNARRDEAFAHFQASNARMEEEIDQLILHLALEKQSITLQEPQPFIDQVGTTIEEVYIEHHEQELPIQVQDDDVDMQEEPLGYGGRQMSKEEMEASIDGVVHFWKAKGLVGEDDEHFEAEDATLEAMHHDPSPNEAETTQVDENPFMPCHEEVIEESRISLPPPLKEHHQEFPKEQVRTLSTHVQNETIEIKVLLPLNPPYSAQCFYDEVRDWKGSDTLVHNPPPHSHTPLPPTLSTSIKSTSSLKEVSRRIIAKKRKTRRKPLLWSSIGKFMAYFCSCLYDASRSPLAPNSTVVLHKKYPP